MDGEEPLTRRSNDEWIADLGEESTQRNSAIAELRLFLVRSMSQNILANWANLSEEDLEDFAQDALWEILDSLHSFRGESLFLTWAQRIATNVAFDELLRRETRRQYLADHYGLVEVSLEEVIESGENV